MRVSPSVPSSDCLAGAGRGSDLEQLLFLAPQDLVDLLDVLVGDLLELLLGTLELVREPGVGHQETPRMREAVLDFFARTLKR